MDSTVFSVSLRPEHGACGLCLNKKEKRKIVENTGNEENKVPKGESRGKQITARVDCSTAN